MMKNYKILGASLWKELKDALSGSEADYTEISMKKAIFLLSVPMVLELVLESVFAVVDIFFVGKLGASAVAAVGLTETFLFLLYSVAMGLSFSVTAIVARRIGEKEKDKAGIAAVQSIVISIFCSLPFAIAGLFYAKDLLGLMGADDWILSEGYHYTQWMLGGNIVIVLIFLLNAVFRGAGDAAIAMKILWISNSINIVLDPIFIFGWGPIPAYGIMGAAMATNIGRGIGVCFQIYLLFRGGKHIKIALKHLKIEWETLLGILKTSLGGIGQMIVAMTSWIFLMRILAQFGSQTVAGATIAMRVMMFTMMPSWGMSNAVATLVGQNLGAGKPNRAEQSVWFTGCCIMVYLICVSIIFFFYSPVLIGFFTDDQDVIRIGSEWLKIVSYSYFIYAWWMAASQAFNGAGDTITPTKINIVFFWMIQIPLAYFLGTYLKLGHAGVFWAMMVSETLVGIFTLWLFTKGKWKETKV